MKTYPKIGEKLYLSKRSGDYYVDMCRDPYTVVRIDGRHVYIQSCELVFKGARYFDTLPDEIKEDTSGKIEALNWYPSKNAWGIDRHQTGYPSFATFGKWDYQPYLD